MSYQGIVTRVKLKPHPNADRLNLAEIAGHQLVCAKDAYEDGDIVIFFPEGGQLSHAVCHENDLYREKKGENKTPGIYGYFEDKRRIRSIKLRGEISEGFMLNLSCFAFTGADLSKIRPGMLITEIGGCEICSKYETRATKQAKAKAGGQQRKDISNFAKVGETSKFRYVMNSIPEGAVITVSEKVHGTSGRTGHISITAEVPEPMTWWERFKCGFQRKYKRGSAKVFRHVSGSRRMIVAEGTQVANLKPDGTEIPLGYRQRIHNGLIGCLHPGESLYYEIVVVNNEGAPDFRQKIGANKSDTVLKSLRKKYGEWMHYSYGVAPGSYGIWIYRITMQNEKGDAVKLGWNQMVMRAGQLGVEVVPQLDQFIYDGDVQALNERLALISDGQSTLDPTHIREGVAVHIDSPRMQQVLKRKGFAFCHLEGIAKNDEDYVDPEEIA